MPIGTLPANLNEDTLPVVLAKQLGQPMKGDGQLHLLAGMPLRVADTHVNTTVNTAATTAGFSAGDATKITTALTNRKAGK